MVNMSFVEQETLLTIFRIYERYSALATCFYKFLVSNAVMTSNPVSVIMFLFTFSPDDLLYPFWLYVLLIICYIINNED